MPRLNRKFKSGMKKGILTLCVLFSCSALFAFDFSVRFMPSYELPVDNFLNNAGGFGINTGFDLSPVTIRSRDKLYLSGQFTYGGYPIKAFGIQSLMDGAFGVGYSFRFSDRLAAFGEGFAGIWNFIGNKELVEESVSGISFGGRAGVDFYVGPALSLTGFAGFKSYYSKPEPFMNTFSIGVGVKYSLSRGLFNQTMISMEESEVTPLFPVFYSFYADNSFGSVTFVNNEPNEIYNVTVSVLVPAYMTTPYKVAEIEGIKIGESFEVPLYAFLNENILDLVQPKTSEMEVTVSYYSLGKLQTTSYSLPVTALNRNSMTWEDDRRAAAFVSGKDATAQRFARQVQAIVKTQLKSSIPANIQYAAAMFGALKAFGINYVVDPSSAFTDNVGTAAVDFLQFPHQTLLYHGGDCDDLTILNCALLEAIGIETAFITVPGHIYMAFDSGLTVEEARGKTGKGYYIEANGKIWCPIEITLSQDTFGLAWTYGAREWKKAGKDAMLIPLKDAWSTYLPISVPGSDTSIDMPSQDAILKNFREANYY
ncbi:MAG: porin family protein [Treponema sp.]|nr:porin family protein [Treponema sp.]